jgi:hypothetical protein
MYACTNSFHKQTAISWGTKNNNANLSNNNSSHSIVFKKFPVSMVALSRTAKTAR